jgi:AraC-like DNA-binding protein
MTACRIEGQAREHSGAKGTGHAMGQRSEHSGTVLAWALPHLLTYLTSRGLSTLPLRHLEDVRGVDLRDPDVRIHDRAAADAWRVAAEITGDAALGVHMAQSIPQGALDLLEYAFRSSETLELGLEQLVRYGRIISDRAAARLVWDRDVLAVTWDGGVERSRADFALAFVLRLAREATHRPLVPLEVRFAHAKPAHPRDYHEFFRAPLRFNAPLNQLLLTREQATERFVSADASLSSVLGRRLEKMMRQLPRRDESVTTRARREVIEGLACGRASVTGVGRRLATSERTLARQLRAEGTSFRRILDEVRRELAMKLLADPTVGMAEIAFILGYSEPAVLHRSLRRWTGQTGRFRRRRRRT